MGPEFVFKCLQEAMKIDGINAFHSRKRQNETDIEEPVSKLKPFVDQVDRSDNNDQVSQAPAVIIHRPIPIHPGNQSIPSTFGAQMSKAPSSVAFPQLQTDKWDQTISFEINSRKSSDESPTTMCNSPDSISSLHASNSTPDNMTVSITPTQTAFQPPLGFSMVNPNIIPTSHFSTPYVPCAPLVPNSKEPKKKSDKLLKVRRPVPHKPMQIMDPVPIKSVPNLSFVPHPPPSINPQNVEALPSFPPSIVAPSYYQGNQFPNSQPRQVMLSSGNSLLLNPAQLQPLTPPTVSTALHQLAKIIQNQQLFQNTTSNVMPLTSPCPVPPLITLAPLIYNPFMTPFQTCSVVNQPIYSPVQPFTGNMTLNQTKVHDTSNPNFSDGVTPSQFHQNHCSHVLPTSQNNHLLKRNVEHKKINKETEKESDTSSTDSILLYKNMAYVKADELDYLYRYLEDVYFDGNDDRMKKVRQRTFMKLLSTVCENGVTDEIMQKCLDIVLRKTLSMTRNSTLYTTKVFISIHHVSLLDVPFCLYGVPYNFFNGASLMDRINMIREKKIPLNFDDSFRIRVEIGECRSLAMYTSQKRTYVLQRSRTFLRAVAIALAYNRQVNGDWKACEVFRRIISEDRYQYKAAKELETLCNIDKNDLKFGYKISQKVSQHFPNLRMTILSRAGITRDYNPDSLECITLSEIRGKFDAVLPL